MKNKVKESEVMKMDVMRVQFELIPEAVIEIDMLVKKTALGNRKELFNTALALLKWAIREKEEGRTIVSIKDGETDEREIVMPALENVTRILSEQKIKAEEKSLVGSLI